MRRRSPPPAALAAPPVIGGAGRRLAVRLPSALRATADAIAATAATENRSAGKLPAASVSKIPRMITDRVDEPPPAVARRRVPCSRVGSSGPRRRRVDIGRPVAAGRRRERAGPGRPRPGRALRSPRRSAAVRRRAGRHDTCLRYPVERGQQRQWWPAPSDGPRWHRHVAWRARRSRVTATGSRSSRRQTISSAATRTRPRTSFSRTSRTARSSGCRTSTVASCRPAVPPPSPASLPTVASSPSRSTWSPTRRTPSACSPTTGRPV